MTLLISSESVPLQIDEGGIVRVGNTRVSLESVIIDYKHGATAEQIALDFPTVDLADIHAVISYYLRHRDEVEQYLVSQRQRADDVRNLVDPLVPAELTRERLLARRNSGTGDAANTGR